MEKAITIKQAARRLNVGVNWIYANIETLEKNGLQTIQHGNKKLIRSLSLDMMISKAFEEGVDYLQVKI